MLGIFASFCRLQIFFQNQFFRIILSVIPCEWKKSLDSDQARRSVGPDLDPNYFERLLADDTSK